MNFKVYQKVAAGEASINKCPVCRDAWQSFADIGTGLGMASGMLLGCYTCGTVFMGKDVRLEDLAGKKDYLDKLRVKAVESATALCGKVCKNPSGKRLHEIHCKKCAELREKK